MSTDALNNPVQFKLPPNQKFAASAFVNAQDEQTITIYQVPDSGNPVQIKQFQGQGLNQTYLGTAQLDSGDSGQIQVEIVVKGNHSSVLGEIVQNPKYMFVLLHSEDGDGNDEDYNDSIVLINWPLT